MKRVILEKWNNRAIPKEIIAAMHKLSEDDQTDPNRIIQLVADVNRLVGNQQITVDSRLFESCTRRIRYCLRKLYEQSAQNLNQDTYQSFKQKCGVAIAFLGSFRPSESIQEEYSKTHHLAFDSLVKLAKNVINDNKATIQSKGQSEEQKRAQMNAYVELVSSTPLSNQKRLFIKMAIEDAVNFNKDNAFLDAAEFFGMVRDISKLLVVIGTDSFEERAQEYIRGIVLRLKKSFTDLNRPLDVDSYQSFVKIPKQPSSFYCYPGQHHRNKQRISLEYSMTS